VAFIVGGVVLQGEPPAYDEPIAEVRDFFADDGQRYLVGDYIVNIAFVLLLLPLIVGLRGRLVQPRGAQIGSRPAAQRPRSWMPSRLPQAEPSSKDSTIRALLYANGAAIAALGVPAALLTVSAAVVIWRTGALWRWLAPLGAIAGLLLVAGAAFPIAQDATGPLFTIRFTSFIAFVIFIVATSLSLVLTHDPSR
jgi:hypothetical protein